ncbi:MAG: hypothetical protein EOO89_06940 [Pedobacter sp.]|nr:MAG: hypothetical protein EOO89_06940 [Pedobacter sp.]
MNHFKQTVDAEEEDEVFSEPELIKQEQQTPVVEGSDNFFKTLFTEGVVSKEVATEMLPFLLYLAFLGMIYIANSHMAINSVRKKDKLNKEVKELSWEYKSLKADLMYKSKLTEVVKVVDTLGLKELIEPPTKLVIGNNEH